MSTLRLILLLNICTLISWGQNTPFWDEIQAFKQQDSLQMPPAGAVLFVGSSSIRLWDDLDTMFPQLEVINRGFGGSTLQDLLLYLPAIVLPYQPSRIVIYCGENDIASGNVSAGVTLKRTKRVLNIIRDHFPEVPVLFISLKPSPSRIRYLTRMRKANKRIERFIHKKPRMDFVNVFDKMLDQQGQPLPHIFLPDDLHMNHQGYLIWQETLQPFLSR